MVCFVIQIPGNIVYHSNDMLYYVSIWVIENSKQSVVISWGAYCKMHPGK